MDEEEDAAEDAVDSEKVKDAGKDEEVTMMKRTGNSHGTMMATAIKLMMIPMTSGTEVEAEAEEEKEKEKALEAKAKERPSKEKAREKEKEKDSGKEKDSLTLPIFRS